MMAKASIGYSALWHRFVVRDDVVARMLRPAR
jgi:cytochrome b561